jgi:hypothetical protein
MKNTLVKLYKEDKELLRSMIAKVIVDSCNENLIGFFVMQEIEKHIDFDYEISVDAEFITDDDLSLDTAIFESINQYIECNSTKDYVRYAGEVEDYVSFFGDFEPKTYGRFKLGKVSELKQVHIYLNDLKCENEGSYAVF